MIEITNSKLILINCQSSITNILCIIKPFGACQLSYLLGVDRFRVQGHTINLNVDSIALVVEYLLLSIVCNLELGI